MFFFQQYSPSAPLQPYIWQYYYCRVDFLSVHKLPVLRVLPTGRVYMNFILNGKPYDAYAGNTRLPLAPAIINGTVCDEDIYLALKSGAVLGIEFLPYGFAALTGLKASDYTNLQADMQTSFRHTIDELHYKLIMQKDVKYRLALLEQWLMQFLRQGIHRYPLLEEALEIIERRGGLITVKELAKAVRMSERNLQKKFLAWIGISPKYYLQIKKVHRFVAHFRQQSIPDLHAFLATYAFYDQSHFIKTFRRMAGMPPIEYMEHHMHTLNNYFTGK